MSSQNLKRKRVKPTNCVQKKSRVTLDHDVDSSEEEEPKASSSEVEDRSSGNEEKDVMDDIEPISEVPNTSAHHTNKPPTGAELRLMKDAIDLYQSSSFKLQIDALLPNVRPNLKESRKTPLDHFLHSLRSHLIAMPAIQPRNPVSAARSLSKKGVGIPFALPHPTEEAKWKVAFEPPSDINVVGSWANQICVKRRDGAQFGVDVTVEMPDSLFQEKDYLDSRYFHKRSFYLAVVAQSLSTTFEVDTLYHAAMGDPRLTMLVLLPRKGGDCDFSKAHAEIHIIPTISPSNPVPLSRLSPSHVNVRLPGKSSNDLRPTPIYNTNILLSTYPKLSLLSTNALKNLAPSFSDAYTLFRVWANQRGYGEGFMCVRGFEGKGFWWNQVLGLIVLGEESTDAGKSNARKPLGKGLSSYQLFRAALDFLAKQDFARNPVFVKSNTGHKYTDEYAHHHSAVFVDSTSTLNLLADVPSTSLSMLRYDAQETLERLNSSSGGDDVFARLFLNDKTHLFKRCDAVISVNLTRASKKQSAHEFVEYGSSDNVFLAAVSRILQRGLNDRVQAIGIFHPSSKACPISEAQSPLIPAIYVGLIYNSENAFRLVDHGPPSEEQNSDATQEFRQLWGNKAELRRFKDGRIIESVVWEVKTSDERAHIPATIVRHLLNRHFGIPVNDIQTTQTYFDAKLRLQDDVSRLFQASGSPGGFKPALSAFDNLAKNLRSLDIPLTLSTISPVSEYLRYTSSLGPVPIPKSTHLALPEPLRYVPTIDIILEFEKSMKWPEDLRAIQQVKLAFFEVIATGLMVANKGLRASVRISNPCESGIQDRASLEIQTAEGWAFSARIWYDREATLLERLASTARTPDRPLASATANPREQREARQALEMYTRQFLHAPRHHRAVANLAHRYTAYASTVRLVKRWLAAHWLLTTHVSAEAVEILCARPFIGSNDILPDNATSVPRSKERGFALVVEFLRDWKPEDPIFVPIYEKMATGSPPTIVAVSSKHGVWTISTSEDTSGRMWTSDGPDVVAVRRLRALAIEACKILQDADTDPVDIERLFSHATDDYDILIELKPTVLPRYHQAINADPSVWSKDRANPRGDDGASHPGFDPAWLLFNDLQVTYSDTLKFFYDVQGGHCIGGIWLPSVSEVRPFRVMGGFSSTPISTEKKAKTKNKDLVMLNRQAVLDEVERLGAGIIKKIVVRKET